MATDGCSSISFLLLLQVLFVCLLSLYIIDEQWKRKGDFIKCELIGGGSPRHKYFLYLLLKFNVSVSYTQQYTLLVLTVSMHTTLSKYQNIPYLVAIVVCTHIESATAPFEDFGTLYRRTLQQIF